MKSFANLPASQITPRALYLRRREFLTATGAALAALATRGLDVPVAASDALTITKKVVTVNDPPTPYDVVTSFNNFYEFGSDKSDPAKKSKAFKPKPWSVAVEGACAKPGVYTLEDILKPHPLEERIYRHRCVEAWSMVIPWVGFQLSELIKRCEPTSKAKFVEFYTLYDPNQMPGVRVPCCAGRTSKGCGWTKRCIRSRFS